MHGPASDVFVSYKAEDRAKLKPLVAALEAEGFSVWWDAQIGGGTNWHEDIEQHLDTAKCVLVAWSKRSVGHDGHFVRDEARRAQRRGTYVPVCLDDSEPPLGFGEIQALSLKAWHGNRSDQRFQAVVHAVRSHVTGEHAPHPHGPLHEPRVSRRKLVLAGGGVAAVAIAGVGAWELLKPSAAAASGSIAVLPFANLSGDPNQAYFADGIADEIRSALTRIGGLTVIGSTSSEAVRNDDARTAAQKLGVATILTGSVRQSPSTIRVSAELIDGRTGADRWTQDYDRNPGDAIKIQTDIAANVATALKGALGLAARAAITLGGTADSEAQNLILQSRKLERESDSPEILRRRIALADAAIARDPDYADAYVEKAFALSHLAANYTSSPAQAADQLELIDAAARKALALTPTLGSAHAALSITAFFRQDFPSALQEAKKSLALSPDDPGVLHDACLSLAYLESPNQALQVCDHAVALDPLNSLAYLSKAEVLTYLHRYPEAIAAGRTALQTSPDLGPAHLWVGDAYLLLGQTGQAKSEYLAIGADDPFRAARLGLLASRTGDRAEAERQLAALNKQSGGTASYQNAEIYTQLGDKDRAFAELDKAVQTKDSGLSYLKVDPFLDPIRGDPRYAALVRRLNFP